MPVPTYDKFIDPILRFLASNPNGTRAREAHEAASQALGLTETDREIRLEGGQPVYKNRAGWAHDRLKRAGLSASPRHGVWQLTKSGFEYATSHPAPLPPSEVERLASEFMDVRLRPLAPEGGQEGSGAEESLAVPAAVASPDERLSSALLEIRKSVAAELLETLGKVSPSFFEAIVLDVLHKLGYGTSRTDLQRVGRSGDGGIDGIISLDKLGLEKVYVQAKRWQSVVGRPDIQAFYGALAGQRANKGVFITTSNFTPQAVEFARSVEKIVLVDGSRLAEFMMDHDVGVTARALRVPRIDSDYFDEDSA